METLERQSFVTASRAVLQAAAFPALHWQPEKVRESRRRGTTQAHVVVQCQQGALHCISILSLPDIRSHTRWYKPGRTKHNLSPVHDLGPGFLTGFYEGFKTSSDPADIFSRSRARKSSLDDPSPLSTILHPSEPDAMRIRAKHAYTMGPVFQT